MSEEGGDPACWVGRVCPECGLFSDVPPPTTCVRCGTELPAPGPEPARPNPESDGEDTP